MTTIENKTIETIENKIGPGVVYAGPINRGCIWCKKTTPCDCVDENGILNTKTCRCGNCTSAPGYDPNESCCFCNGSIKQRKQPKVKYIGAINRINGHKYLAVTHCPWYMFICGGVGMGVLMEDKIYEGMTTASNAEKMVRKFVNEDKWERMTEAEVKATGVF